MTPLMMMATIVAQPLIPYRVLDYNMERAVLAIPSHERYVRYTAAIKDGPATVSTSLAVRVLPHIRENDDFMRKRIVLDGGYKWKPGTHDLNRPPGRAAALIEMITGEEMPKVRPDSTPEECSEVYAKAVAAVDRLVERHKKRPPSPGKPTIEELRSQVQGKILGPFGEETRPKPGQKAAYRLALDELVRRWDPIGKKVTDLEAILGRPLHEEERLVPGLGLDKTPVTPRDRNDGERVFTYVIANKWPGSNLNAVFSFYTVRIITSADGTIRALYSRVTG